MSEDRILGRWRRLIAAYSVSCVLAGCAGWPETPNVSHDYMLSPASGKGVVIASITSPNFGPNYQLIYRKVDGGQEGYFQLASPNPSFDAALIAAELPAGDYEIYRWRIRTRFDFPETVSVTPFSIRFHVAPGEAVYIGSCTFNIAYPERAAARWTGDVLVVCNDQSRRDLIELAANHPGLSATDVRRISAGGEIYRSDKYQVWYSAD